MSLKYPWQRLALLPRASKQIILMLSDCVLLLLSAYLAFVIRLGFVFVPNEGQTFLIFIAPVLAIPVLSGSGFIAPSSAISPNVRFGRFFRPLPLRRFSGLRSSFLWNSTAVPACRARFRCFTGF